MIYFTCKSGSQHRIAVVNMLNQSQPRQKTVFCASFPVCSSLNFSWFEHLSLGRWRWPFPESKQTLILIEGPLDSSKQVKAGIILGIWLMLRCLHSLMNPQLTLCDGNISHYSCVCQLAVSFQMANTKIAWKNSFRNSGSKRILLILQQIFQDVQTVHSLLTIKHPSRSIL